MKCKSNQHRSSVIYFYSVSVLVINQAYPFSLTSSFQEWGIGCWLVILTFQSVDKILWCFPFNPFTARVFDIVLWGNSNFWVCGRIPIIWPFKRKLSALTFTWCYLFVKILENEIWKFGQNLPLATFGSHWVKWNLFGWFFFFAWYNFLWIFFMNLPWQLLGVNRLL